MLLLHGEQYLELKHPLPRAGQLKTTTRIIDVLDKGKAALIVVGMTTTDATNGTVIAENETTVFLRGSGGFGEEPVGPSRQIPCMSHTPCLTGAYGWPHLQYHTDSCVIEAQLAITIKT